MRLRTLALIGALCLPVISQAHGQSDTAGTPQVSESFSIPLEDGRVDLGRFFAQLCERLGLGVSGAGAGPWMVDVKELVHSWRIEQLGELTDGVIGVQATEQALVVHMDRQRLNAKVDQVRQAVMRWWHEARSGESEGLHGISFVIDDGRSVPSASLSAPPQRVVLLVHGVDDPGWMWRDVIAALRGKDLAVARLDYPNDGPISESADLLAAELAKLRAAGVKRVDLVAKSMGGLVCREVLTRPAHYNGDGAGGDRFPAVQRLIMIGTPNHGSIMARMRGLAEMAEHASRLFAGRNGSLDFNCDGCGEAGVDLMPNSDFLRRLNARPLPQNVKITIIAGRLSPVSEEAASAWGRRVSELAHSESSPQWLKHLAEQGQPESWAGMLAKSVRGIGDGMVTLDSARLEGVGDVVEVEGDHLGMVINLLPSSQRIPPAIPVILDRLDDKSD